MMETVERMHMAGGGVSFGTRNGFMYRTVFMILLRDFVRVFMFLA